jgi:hypothetical protein
MADTPSKSTAKKANASKKTTAKAKTATTAKKTTAKKASNTTASTKSTAKRAAPAGRLDGARSAVNQQLETVVAAASRVNGLVAPITGRVAGDDRVAALRGQVEGILRTAEKSGSAVREDASKRFAQISGNKTLKVLGDRAEKIQTDLSRVLEGQSARAQELIGQAREQVSALRP